MFKRVKKFSKDESGAAMAEYALLTALIAIVAIAAVGAVGTNVQSAFNKVALGLSCGVNGQAINSKGTACVTLTKSK